MLLAEIKRILKSFVYWIILFFIVIQWYNNFYGIASSEIKGADVTMTQTEEIIQDGDTNSSLKKPDINGKYEKSENHDFKIMIGATDQLLREYRNNKYTTYPFGYYKAVTLNKEEQIEILEVLCEITGLTEKQLNNLPEDYFPANNGTIFHPKGYTDDKISTDKTKRFQSQVTFLQFEKLMDKVCSIVGPKSEYSMERLEIYFGSGKTYEESQKIYEDTMERDRVTGGFARYYCDVLSTVMSLLPVFLATYLWLLDRKRGVKECIYVKSISSAQIVISRILAMLLSILIPVIALSFEALIPLYGFAIDQGVDIDCLAFVKYIFWWLMPTVLITICIGSFVTVLTETPIAIALQWLWWFLSRGSMQIVGDTKWYSLAIRHNSLQEYKSFHENIQNIWFNRIGITLFSIVLILLSIFILTYKRKGGLNIKYVYDRFAFFDKRKY